MASKKPQRKTLERIQLMRDLHTIYGTMTVRQVYYKLITGGLNYRHVQTFLATGRECGLIPYDWIVDRSRPSYGTTMWDSEEEYLEIVPGSFRLDYWANSDYKVEVWTEKDALSQILYEEAAPFRVPVRVTRGFDSITNVKKHGASNLVVLYFGDFDPSGMCVDETLNEKLECLVFHRVALTYEQTYGLPPVPLKDMEYARQKGKSKGDPRAKKYESQYGPYGWELDAMDPNTLRKLVRDSITALLTFDLEQKRMEEQEIRDNIRRLIGGEQA